MGRIIHGGVYVTATYKQLERDVCFCSFSRGYIYKYTALDKNIYPYAGIYCFLIGNTFEYPILSWASD